MKGQFLDQLRQVLGPLRAQVANLVARAVVTLVNDAAGVQLVQLGCLADETVDDGERMQPYGFTSVPLPGAEAAVLFPDGDRGRPLVVVVDDRRHRPRDGQPGEVALYTHEGDTIRLAKDHHIVATTTGDIRLGSDAATTPPALADELADLKSRIAAWTPVAMDGGASLKAVFAAWPTPGATKVKVE